MMTVDSERNDEGRITTVVTLWRTDAPIISGDCKVATFEVPEFETEGQPTG